MVGIELPTLLLGVQHVTLHLLVDPLQLVAQDVDALDAQRTASGFNPFSTQLFLRQVRDSQLFEAWARERAALVKRSAAESPTTSPAAGVGRAAEGARGKEKFSLALYDKFEALVEVEGEFVGMTHAWLPLETWTVATLDLITLIHCSSSFCINADSSSQLAAVEGR